VADPNLNESAWQRAKVEAAGVYRTTTFQLGGTLLAAIFSALALIAQEGQPITTQGAILVLAAAVAIILSVVIVFACQLAAAPVRQRTELRQAWHAPEVKTVNVRLTLRNLHRKGGELTRRGTSMGISRRDEMKMEEWADGVVDFLVAHIPEDLAQTFIVAGVSEAGAGRRLQAQLKALQQIIDKLEVDEGLR
jgi:hypothetical protein